ncbi:MAG: TolC family protein [Nitrospiraceae bacterium]|nr:TolC family protein [Nitrospiraceae bacterium]
MRKRIRRIGFLGVAVMLSLQVHYASAEVLTLPEGLRLATENSRLMKISQKDEKMSLADTRIEKSGFYPTVDASVSGTMLAHEPNAIFGTQSVPVSNKDFYAYGVSVRQMLYDFKKTASRYESSVMRLKAQELDTGRVKNLVAIDFALAYFDLLESEKVVSVGEKEVERLEAHLRDAENLYKEGVITKNDLLQAQVRLSDARQRLLTARTSRDINAARLNEALVRPLTTSVEVTDIKEPLPESEVVVGSFEKAWEAAEKERPEIRIADATLKSLDLDEESKRAEYYPRLFAAGGYDYTRNEYQTPQGNWSLTLGVGLNLFSGGRTKAELEKIGAEREKLLEQRKRLVDQVRLEVQRYILDARTARDRVAVTKDAVRQAEENLRINRVRYTEGVGTATEVLDAVTLLSVAETNHFMSVYDLAKSEIAVMYAIGKDLTEVYK